jgi:hypothetical protein
LLLLVLLHGLLHSLLQTLLPRLLHRLLHSCQSLLLLLQHPPALQMLLAADLLLGMLRWQQCLLQPTRVHVALLGTHLLLLTSGWLLMGGLMLLVVVEGHSLLQVLLQNMFCQSLLLLLHNLGVLTQLLGRRVLMRAPAQQQCYSRRLLLLLRQPKRLPVALASLH